MGELMRPFDREHREYQDCLDEKSWAGAALAQPHLLETLHCMWVLRDRKVKNTKQYHEEIVRQSHRIG